MSQELPKHWSKMKPDENLKLVDLKSSDKEYQSVLAEFIKTLGRTPQIITVPSLGLLNEEGFKTHHTETKNS